MILKEYFNFENEIANNLLTVRHFERKPSESINIPDNIFNSFFILINIGHIIQAEMDCNTVLCPPKNGFLGINKHLSLILNDKCYSKFTLITLSKNFQNEIIEKINRSIPYPADLIFKSNSYCFSFALNICVIELIEELYKTTNSKIFSSFYYLEIESNFLRLLTTILKVILFDDHRYNKMTATDDSKFLAAIKQIIKSKRQKEEILPHIDLPIEKYNNLYEKYFENIDIFDIADKS